MPFGGSHWHGYEVVSFPASRSGILTFCGGTCSISHNKSRALTEFPVSFNRWLRLTRYVRHTAYTFTLQIWFLMLRVPCLRSGQLPSCRLGRWLRRMGDCATCGLRLVSCFFCCVCVCVYRFIFEVSYQQMPYLMVGLPQDFRETWGLQFTSKLFEEARKALEVKGIFSSQEDR